MAADANPTIHESITEATPLPTAGTGDVGIRAEDFEEGFGETIVQALDLNRWRCGFDLASEYRRIQEEVEIAVRQETACHRQVREEIHPKLAEMAGAPKGAGRHEVPLSDIVYIHRNILFPGGVEACDGNSNVHQSLPLTIHQLGVALVSYQGDQGTWGQRLFRRDLRLEHGDLIGRTLDLLERRAKRGGLNHPSPKDQLSELAQRALMSYSERAVLAKRSTAIWRMGHGSPAPLELLTGGGSPDLMIESIRVIRHLIEQHQKFVFVASEPADFAMLTIGQALRPSEFAIVGTLQDRLESAVETIHFSAPVTVDDRWDGEPMTPEKWVWRFVEEVAPKVVTGVYRATLLGPPHLFYAHIDHADIAARIALADSVLQEHRGFPLLIDLADRVCAAVYGGRTLRDMADAAYTALEVPFRFQSERSSRSA